MAAAPYLAGWVRSHVERPLLIGPDSESAQWVSEVAAGAGAPYRVLVKRRLGDRKVEITVPDLSQHSAFTPVLVDDIISSGTTMAIATESLERQGLRAPVLLAVHALFAEGAYATLNGKASVVATTNTVAHPSNAVDLTEPIAGAINSLLERQPNA